jgi:hypothetical protein
MPVTIENSDGQIRSMWVEAGLQFRSNLLTPEHPFIALHRHSFDHVAIITHGWVRVEETYPDGRLRRYQMASKDFVPSPGSLFYPCGYRVLIPKWHQHSFELIECHGQPAEILCVFPEAFDDEGARSGGC